MVPSGPGKKNSASGNCGFQLNHLNGRDLLATMGPGKQVAVGKAILFAAGLGLVAGGIWDGGDLKMLSQLGKLIIHWVKLVAGPFLFLTILAAIVEVRVEWKHGLRMIAIALVNTCAAIVIGIVLAKAFLSGADLAALPVAKSAAPAAPTGAMGFDAWLKTLSPKSLFAPFIENEILLIAMLALVSGIAIRRTQAKSGAQNLTALALKIEGVRAVFATFLAWLIYIIPFAVFALVAGAVSEYGFGILGSLAKYVVVVIVGFLLQAGLIYSAWIFAFARLRPYFFFQHARGPVFYALGVNSSLATLPMTLGALEAMGISKRSASLGAGVATNLNNDGIVLYEAMAIFFIAHVHGIQMSSLEMLTAALTCLIAAWGITGIPEAGFISLSVVVSTLGFPAEMLPLLLAVDWIIARGRSVVNVLSDMTLSIALDAVERKKGMSHAH